MRRLPFALLWLAFVAVIGAIVFASAGRWDLPMVWAVLALLAATMLVFVSVADPGLLRERVAPGGTDRDRATRLLSAALLVAHWVLAGLDAGRFQWSPVPFPLQVAGLAGYALAMPVLVWAMRANRFYSSAVRVQRDRGQRPITTGPYGIVRHPGYAASILASIAGGLAFGSWLAMAPILAFAGLFVRRTIFEDGLLCEELEGYAEYARDVRFRLVPGVF